MRKSNNMTKFGIKTTMFDFINDDEKHLPCAFLVLECVKHPWEIIKLLARRIQHTKHITELLVLLTVGGLLPLGVLLGLCCPSLPVRGPHTLTVSGGGWGMRKVIWLWAGDILWSKLSIGGWSSWKRKKILILLNNTQY